MLCDCTLFTIGFIVNSGEEEVIADNYGDDEADDLETKEISTQQTCRY